MSETDQAPEESGELMYVKCAECGRWLDVKPGGMNKVSHTLCKECLEKQLRELDEMDPPAPPPAEP